MNFKGNMSVFELLEQPFNVVHEMYRLVYLKNLAQKQKEELEKKEKEEKEKEERKAREEQIRGNTPAFATKNEVLGRKDQVPPSNEVKATQNSPAAEAAYKKELERRAKEGTLEVGKKISTQKSKPKHTPNSLEALSNPVVQQMSAGQLQDILEEVIS